MNTNQPTPDPLEVNAAIAKKLRSWRWQGRALTFVALSVGLLAIVAGLLLGWASSIRVMPMERLLLQDYPNALVTVERNSAPNLNAEGKVPLTRDELDLRHVQVTAAHGKVLFLTAAAIVLLAAGTFLTLLLVIFNRQVTLRQINASLAQISEQIKAQGGRGA